MCAIVDASATYEVFGRKQTTAGRRFREWLDSGHGQLVVGGKALRELLRNGNFEKWFLEARRSPALVRQLRAETILEKEKELGGCQMRSNDQHVVALALVSGARLLYTNDKPLQLDFTNSQIISGVAGRIYASRTDDRFTDDHQTLLDAPDLCIPPKMP